MNDKIHYIFQRLPEKKHLIALLLAKDPEFVSLFEDYNDCVYALRHWGQSKAPEAQTRVHEYNSLVQELEEEIHQALEAFSSRQLD